MTIVDAANIGGQTSFGGMSDRLTALGQELAIGGQDLAALAELFGANPSLEPLMKPTQLIGSTLFELGKKLAGQTGADEAATGPGALGTPGTTTSGTDEADGLESLQQQMTERKQIYADFFKAVTAMEKKNAEDAMKLEEEKNQAAIESLGALLGETILGSKKMAKIQRAHARFKVIRDGAEAIMTATKSLPWPLNLPAIAFATIMGKKQEAVVNQAHAGLDRVPATATYLLEKGERVIGRRLNQDLSSFLTASNDAVAGGTIDRSVRRSSTFNPTINLSIGGGATDDAVLANRGAVETMIREIYADYALQSPFGA